jgi:hypothetical protein
MADGIRVKLLPALLEAMSGRGKQQQLGFHLAMTDLLDGESRVAQGLLGVTVGVAAVGEPAPWALEAVLPAAQPGAGLGGDVLDEQQPSVRLRRGRAGALGSAIESLVAVVMVGVSFGS